MASRVKYLKNFQQKERKLALREIRGIWFTKFLDSLKKTLILYNILPAFYALTENITIYCPLKLEVLNGV